MKARVLPVGYNPAERAGDSAEPPICGKLYAKEVELNVVAKTKAAGHSDVAGKAYRLVCGREASASERRDGRRNDEPPGDSAGDARSMLSSPANQPKPKRHPGGYTPAGRAGASAETTTCSSVTQSDEV